MTSSLLVTLRRIISFCEWVEGESPGSTLHIIAVRYYIVLERWTKEIVFKLFSHLRRRTVLQNLLWGETTQPEVAGWPLKPFPPGLVSAFQCLPSSVCISKIPQCFPEFSLCIYVSVFVCMYMFACVNVHVYTYAWETRGWQCVLGLFTLHYVRHGLSWDLELTYFARLSGQWTSGIYLSLFP